MSEQKIATRVKLRDVRLAFPVLFNPEQFNGQGELAYSGVLLFGKDHPQIAAIKEAIRAAAQAKWPRDWETILKAGKAKDQYTLHDGDVKGNVDGYAGNYYINFRNSGRKGAPPAKLKILDRDRRPLTQSDGKPYAGCYVIAILDFWAQDNSFGKKVNASLAGMQFYRDGDAFAGGSVAADEDFEDLGFDDDAPVTESDSDDEI